MNCCGCLFSKPKETGVVLTILDDDGASAPAVAKAGDTSNTEAVAKQQVSESEALACNRARSAALALRGGGCCGSKALNSKDVKVELEEATKTTSPEAQQQVSEAQGIARLADFRELRALGGGCAIAKTEERGITLPQLRAVKAQIDRRCVAEAWTDWEGRALRPETVSLYDAAKYVIKPATVERQCSFVELFAAAPQLPKWFVSHWWGEPVRPPPLPFQLPPSPHPLSKPRTTGLTRRDPLSKPPVTGSRGDPSAALPPSQLPRASSAGVRFHRVPRAARKGLRAGQVGGRVGG